MSESALHSMPYFLLAFSHSSQRLDRNNCWSVCRVAAVGIRCDMTKELSMSSAKLDDQECEGMSWTAEQQLELEDGTEC